MSTAVHIQNSRATTWQFLLLCISLCYLYLRWGVLYGWAAPGEVGSQAEGRAWAPWQPWSILLHAPSRKNFPFSSSSELSWKLPAVTPTGSWAKTTVFLNTFQPMTDHSGWLGLGYFFKRGLLLRVISALELSPLGWHLADSLPDLHHGLRFSLHHPAPWLFFILHSLLPLNKPLT